jgi:hypothetical protein
MSITKELYEYYKAQCNAYEVANKKPRKAKALSLKDVDVDIITGGLMVEKITHLKSSQHGALESRLEKLWGYSVSSTTIDGFLLIGIWTANPSDIYRNLGDYSRGDYARLINDTLNT